MGRRALIGTIATLGLVAIAGLFAVLLSLLSSPDLVYAQANSALVFPPVDANEDYTRSVPENTAAFQNIGAPVKATAADTDDKLIYSLENARNANFTIHQRTGQLQVGGPLDYETTNSYTVTVKATDPSGDSDTIEVTINVNDVDEDGRVSLSWTKPQVGTEITATLTDPDGSISGKSWKWSHSSSRNGEYIEISDATSNIYTPAQGDKDKYLRATVVYTDGEDSGKTASTTSAVDVRDVPGSNNAPVFYESSSGSYDCNDDDKTTFCMYVSKSDPVGEDIYYPVRATDDDPGDEIRYSLEGDGHEHFYIEPTRGELFIEALPRSLTEYPYEFTIRASDQSSASNTITVTIKSSGSANNPVVVGPSRITYPENGTWPVATYSASNSKGPINGWIIGVEPGGGDGDFFKMTNEGVLLFEQPPDYEAPADYPYPGADKGNNTYSFSLHVYDTQASGGRPGQSFFNVTVTVVDVDEILEIGGPSVVDYPENSRDVVATYTVPEANGPVTWSPPSGTDGEHFSIEGGVLTFIRLPDYEDPLDLDGGGDDGDQPDNAYLVAITVEDSTHIKTEHVRVRVTDVNEPPEFDEGLETSITVEADIGPNQSIGDPFTATDPDKGDYPDYTVVAVPAPPFQIDPHTGQLSTSLTLDQFDSPSYTMTVFVTDGKDDEGNADTATDDRITVTVTVTVAGGGNAAPVFPAAALNFNVDENTTTVETVGTPVTATDDDTDDTLSYSLDATGALSFDINSSSGQISTKTGVPYDHETTPSYSVTVTVNDGNGGTATKVVTIAVTNEEEDGTVTLSTNQPSARVAITASLTDPDGVVANTTIWKWAKSIDGTNWTNVSVNSLSYTPLDTDVGSHLQATASYTDNEDSGKTASEQTTQQVGAGTNRAPEFGDTSTTRDVAENTVAGEPVGAVVTANDPDNDTLAYSLTGGDAGLFDFDTVTGQIKVKAGTALDYEGTRKSYTVVVEVTDKKDADGNANTVMDDSIAVTINVTNVNEAPEFDSATTERSIAENSEANANVGAPVTATDPDNDDTLIYALSGADASLFDFDTGTGQIKVAAGTILDYEGANKTYTVDVEVRNRSADVSADATIAVTINVIDVNEDPAFDGLTAARAVPENTAAGQPIEDPVQAEDPDAGATLTYALGGTDATSFDIDTSTGQLKTKAALDKETDDTYEVTVSVHDGKNEAGTADTAEDASITVTINVTNADDDGTVILSTYQPPARAEITATLTDPDDDITGTTWQWSRSLNPLDLTDHQWVNINNATSASYTPLDADLTYYLQATASYTDGEGSGKSAKAETTQAVGAGTNRPPDFGATSTTRSFPEDTAANTNIGDPVVAYDPDTGNILTYSLEGTDAASFYIVDTSGQIQTISGVTYDHETKASYSVTVKADDKNGGTATIDVTITVTDANDPPDFGASNATRAVAENTAGNTNIGAPVTASDADSDTLTYSLEGTDKDSFQIVLTSGQIQTKLDVTYDHETKPTYSVTVKADDKNGGEDTIEVTINVTNVNEAPTVEGETSVSYPENGDGTVATYSATDPDPEDDQITWKVLGTDSTHFSISSAGQLTFDPPPDFENPVGSGTDNAYVVTVQASDGSETHQLEVTVTVTDVNEAPVFPAGSDARSVAENTAADQNIGAAVAAEDPDDGDTLTLTYDLGGADAASFGINTSTGQLQTKDDLDKETKDTYTVTVTASDDSLSTTQEVTITVTDVNEKPAFDSNAVTLAVAENTEPGENVGVAVEASDPDVDATLTYSLGGTDDSLFTIDGSMGQIKVGAGTTLDYEAPKTEYSVTVSVRDNKDDGGNTDTAPDDTITVTINVTQVNEPPVLTGSANESYAENRTDAVATYTAADPEKAKIQWTLAGDDAGDFSIEGGVLKFDEGGVLKFDPPPNYEAPADEGGDNVYLVTVQASDGDHSDTLPVTITVIDANDPPAFPGLTATQRVAENTVEGQPVGDLVAATDQDTGDTLTYTLGGTDAASFDIDAASGQLLTKTALDHETDGTYEVVVSVTDSKADDGSADPSVDAEITVTITVTDVNEPPEITGDPTFNYPENGADAVVTYTATDPEKVDLVWSLGGDDSNLFSITGGALSFKNSPDFENPADAGSNNTYSVTVTVSDGSLTDDVEVTVTVTNVDEAGEVTLSALQPQARTGLVATVTDPDTIVTHDTWLWEISSGPTNWSRITGANAGTYVPLDGDVGKHLRVHCYLHRQTWARQDRAGGVCQPGASSAGQQCSAGLQRGNSPADHRRR